VIRGLTSFMLFLILFTPAYAANEVVILAPEHETRVVDQTVWLVVSRAGGLKDITVVLKNKDTVKKIEGKDYKDVFHALLNLEPGLNEITIGEKTLFLSCSPKYGPAYTPTGSKKGFQKYPPYLFHTPEKERNCSWCHKGMDIVEADSKALSQPDCVKCHAELLTSARYLHGPLGGKACFVCHDPASTPSKFAPRFGGKGKLCFGCHQELSEKQSRKRYFHGPVGADECVACHDPHGSRFRYQLVEKGKPLCYLCHDQKRFVGGKIIHAVVQYDGCAACHDPHASDYKAQLIDAERALCAKAECHPRFKGLTRGHPTTEHPLMGVRDPFRPEREFSCSSCHNPHASDFSFLLPGVGYSVCSKCH
jgi:predicted CXXCH cytochrome family protein